ncbi:iron-sulfur cluster repair di-iron protein [Archangium gephyra]|uniref:iron-sulfur cluster repair di-iron protein n=1 Tax=Archangium gephyra TaxID=48 RepID=UPI003B78041D
MQSLSSPFALTPTTTVGELAASRPSSTRVFSRRGIDFCCGGGKTLEEACRRRGLDPQEVLREIQQELERGAGEPVAWTERSQAELIQHIVAHYHEPLREELRRLHGMALKVLRVHGEKDPERLSQLADTFVLLKDELEPHMEKEERILFPWILSGRPVPQGGPIERMMFEHEQAGQLLVRLRELTGNYEVPPGACNTWRALWNGLEALERELHEHIHLENNILFPRASGRA